MSGDRGGRCRAFLGLVLAGLPAGLHAQVANRPPDAAPAAGPAASASDCKAIADRLTAAFPGSVAQSLYSGERWAIDLPDGIVIRLPCRRRGVSLYLGDENGPRAVTAARLGIADRSAEIFSGTAMQGAAARCLRAVKRVQKRAGKVGRAHAREINKIPHFEGEVVAGAMTVWCRYDYESGRTLEVFYDLPAE